MLCVTDCAGALAVRLTDAVKSVTAADPSLTNSVTTQVPVHCAG